MDKEKIKVELPIDMWNRIKETMELMDLERLSNKTIWYEAIDYLHSFVMRERKTEFLKFVKRIEQFSKAIIKLHDEGVFDRTL